ncbi:hypothetical protein ASG50_17605 [Rhizobium sp. Leaf386]|nr:hypothetical protein ASG50_17605 [Rhizobium sp. Leaf386]
MLQALNRIFSMIFRNKISAGERSIPARKIALTRTAFTANAMNTDVGERFTMVRPRGVEPLFPE